MRVLCDAVRHAPLQQPEGLSARHLLFPITTPSEKGLHGCTLGSMNPWAHLFQGEFAQREAILAELTLEQVTDMSHGQAHSIYAE